MYYNINYEIVAVLLLGFILISKRQYLLNKANRIEHNFWGVVLACFLACSVDIIAALAYSDIIPASDMSMLLIETAYLILALFTVYFQLIVICQRLGFESDLFQGLNGTAVGIMIIALVINIGVHFMFEYTDNLFVGYPLFNSIYLVNGMMYAEMLGIIIYRRKSVRRKVAAFSALTFLFPIVGIVLQFIDDTLLLSGICVAAACFMFSFTLGDQDYEEMLKTLEELEKLNEQDRERQKEIEATYRVKQRFMEAVSGEIRVPVEEIKQTNRRMVEIGKSDKISDYAKQIESSSEQLLGFVDELLAEAGAMD